MQAIWSIANLTWLYAYPYATNVTLISGKALPGLASKYLSGIDPSAAIVTYMSYQANIAEFRYSENGIKFRELMTVVIEDYGRNGGGLWKNRETMLIRAPEGHLSKWEAVLNAIKNSAKWNLNWVTDEVNNQRRRTGQIIATHQEIQTIDKAINYNRQNTNTEINKEMYLTLTGQD